MPLKLGGVVFLLAVGATAHAQATSKPAAAPPPAPTMSAEGKKFVQAWLGQWTSNDATMSMGEQKTQGSLKMSCESVSSGWGTLCRGTFDIKGQPPSAATFLMAWDTGAGKGHMFEVADTAEVHDHSGQWTDDKSISLVHQGKNTEGKDETDTCKATWPSARELRLECTGSQAGATVWTFATTCRK